METKHKQQAITDETPVARWNDKAIILVESMARRCVGCFQKGLQCRRCLCNDAAAIIRERDLEQKTEAVKTYTGASKANSPADRRRKALLARIPEGVWLRVKQIKFAPGTRPGEKSEDLACLNRAGLIEKRSPEADNTRVVEYRKPATEK